MTDFRAGKFVIIVDDEDRENEGDLVIAAEFATLEAINFSKLTKIRIMIKLCFVIE